MAGSPSFLRLNNIAYPHGGNNLVWKVDIYHTIIQMKYKIIVLLFGEVHSAIKHVQEKISICSSKIRER